MNRDVRLRLVRGSTCVGLGMRWRGWDLPRLRRVLPFALTAGLWLTMGGRLGLPAAMLCHTFGPGDRFG